jgi:hypothetical protein
VVRNSSGAVPECLRSLAWRYLIADSRAKMSTSSLLAGVAGESFVAAELSRRGVIASITLRNTRGIDIVVTNKGATKTVTIQCKTSRKKKRRKRDFYPTRHPLAAPAHEQLRRPRSAAAVRLDARDESDCLPMVGVAPRQIGHHGQSASLKVVTITTRPTLPRQPPEVDPKRSPTEKTACAQPPRG